MIQLILFLILSIFYTAPSYSIGVKEKNIGIFASLESRAQGEALAASCHGSSCLFYNPAKLSWERFNLNFYSGSVISDKNSSETGNTISSENIQEDLLNSTLKDYESSKKYFEADISLLEISVPHFAAQGFTSLSIENSPSPATQDIKVDSNLGFIGGFSLSSNRFSIGVSHYRIFKNTLYLSPTEVQIAEANVNIENEDLDTIPLGDYSTAEQGYAAGYNVALFYAFDDEGASGLGISVLNAGGVSFTDDIEPKASQVNDAEKEINEFLTKYGITKTLPQDIPEIVNAAISVGNNEDVSTFHFIVSAESQDIGGDYIEHKNVASFRAGIKFPADLALATSYLIETDRDKYTHFGISGFQAFGCYRDNDVVTLGGKMSFHIGYQRRFSILQFDISGMNSRNLKEDEALPVEYSGMTYNLALELIF